MTLDWFTVSLGIAKAEVTLETRALMFESAEAFLRVGALSAQEWQLLSPVSREVFMEASTKLRAEMAALVAHALASTIDGADTLETVDRMDDKAQAVLDAEIGRTP